MLVLKGREHDLEFSPDRMSPECRETLLRAIRKTMRRRPVEDDKNSPGKVRIYVQQGRTIGGEQCLIPKHK